MIFLKLKSLTDIDIPDVKADYKSAKRVGQYKISQNAIYKPDGEYVPICSVTERRIDKSSVHVSGCCAGGVLVERLVLSVGEDRYQFVFDTKKEIDRAIQIIGFEK